MANRKDKKPPLAEWASNVKQRLGLMQYDNSSGGSTSTVAPSYSGTYYNPDVGTPSSTVGSPTIAPGGPALGGLDYKYNPDVGTDTTTTASVPQDPNRPSGKSGYWGTDGLWHQADPSVWAMPIPVPKDWMWGGPGSGGAQSGRGMRPNRVQENLGPTLGGALTKMSLSTRQLIKDYMDGNIALEDTPVWFQRLMHQARSKWGDTVNQPKGKDVQGNTVSAWANGLVNWTP